MVSWGEILFTVTAASYLLGRRELPKMGRFIGLYAGRAVGATIRAKKEFFDATKDHEIVKLQREFQKGIAELNDIRSELTSVGSITRPHTPVSAPVGTAPSTATATASSSAAKTYAGGAAGMFQSSSAAGASTSSVTPESATTVSAIRPSVDVAALSERNEKRGEIESLALAELKLAERGSYATRIESLEGGADYVAASIVDSLLLDRVDKKPRSSKPQ